MTAPITFRAARRGDGSTLWQLVQSVGVLELNSAYFYLTFAEFFGKTCLIAQQQGECVGCVIAFRPPDAEKALFVWQVGVSPSLRRRGLGKQMIQELLIMPACREVSYLLATISPNNEASLRMFMGLAELYKCPCSYTDFFNTTLFPESHEEEKLIRIGPLA